MPRTQLAAIISLRGDDQRIYHPAWMMGITSIPAVGTPPTWRQLILYYFGVIASATAEADYFTLSGDEYVDFTVPGNVWAKVAGHNFSDRDRCGRDIHGI